MQSLGKEQTTIIRRLVKGAVILVLYLLGSLFRQKGIPILAYHSIDDSGSPLSISPALFRRQMAYLKRKGYSTISLDTLGDLLRSRKPLPPRAVVLTFDDGFKNNHDIALPVLKQHGFTAILFLTTGYVARSMTWKKTPDIPDLPMASWAEIQAMADSGIDIQAHSVTHPNLCQLPLAQAQEEIQVSKETIAARLGKEVTYFAYPYGEWNDQIKAMVKQLGFKGAVSYAFGLTKVGDDGYALKRINVNGISRVGERTQMLFFRCCLLGSACWYIALKSRFPALTLATHPWRSDHATEVSTG